MPLNMQPLSDRFGVAITNVDLSKDIDERLFDEIVDVFVKKQVLVFRDQHIEPQHQVAFSRDLARSKCCMTRISGCRASRRSPSFPMRRSTANSSASSRPAISGIRTSPTDERLHSRLSSMPISCPSTAAIRNSPICTAPMKAYPMTSKTHRGAHGYPPAQQVGQSACRGDPRGWRRILSKTGHQKRAPSDRPYPSCIGPSLCLAAFYRRYRGHGRRRGAAAARYVIRLPDGAWQHVPSQMDPGRFRDVGQS